MTAVWTELVEDARFAPSPHNTQPWRVRPRSDDEAELEVPVERLLPVEDPQGRSLTAGVGIFLEALDGTGSFALLAGEDEQANKTLTVAVDLRSGGVAPADAELVRRSLLSRLAEVDQDYREAGSFIPAGFEPRLEFHAAGTGPFAGHDVRLKRTYVQSV